MIRNYIILLFFILLSLFSNAQQKLSLNDVINLAKEKSIRSKQIENKFQNSYWRNFSFRKQFLPSLVFDGTIPEFSRTISSVTQPDGSALFVNRNLITNRSNLSINQAVPATGGNVFLRTGLDNIQLSGNTHSTTYLSRPVEFGYTQSLFGFNQYKWDKKIEPLYFSEAELFKAEELEDLSVQSVNKYFDLLQAQLSMKNAELNYLNNDTIYLIGKGRYKYGKIAENELLQLELSLLNAEMIYEQEKLNFELSRQKLATFLGYPSQEKFELSLDSIIPDFTVTYEQALTYATEYNSTLIQQERQVSEAEMNVAKVKSENRFNLNLSASYGLTQTAASINDVYTSPKNQQFVSMGIRVPIIQWGLGKGKIRQAESNAELVRSTAQQQKIDFEQDIFVKVAEFNLNRKQLKVSEKAKEVAEKRFFVTKQRYLIGKILVTDLQIAQQEKDKALINYIDAYRAFWQSYYNIRKITHYDFENQTIIGS